MKTAVDTRRSPGAAAFQKASFERPKRDNPQSPVKKNKPKTEPAKAIASLFENRDLSNHPYLIAVLDKYKVAIKEQKNNAGFSISISPKESQD